MNYVEIQKINDWIRQGGSLLALTYHDNYQFDEFLQSLGVQTNEIDITLDSIHGLERDGISIQPAFIVFSEKDKLLGNHPIIWGRNDSEKVSLVKTFAGGISIVGPPGSSVLLRLSEFAVDLMRIGPIQDPSVPVKTKGLRSFGIAFTYGKGRVVLVSAAETLTAAIVSPSWGKIGMNTPGSDNKQFALNIMRWLTGYLK